MNRLNRSVTLLLASTALTLTAAALSCAQASDCGAVTLEQGRVVQVIDARTLWLADGREIRRDQAVFLALGAANRDPAVFADPERFDVGRDASALLTFGKGRHSCIGAPLVRLQVEGALRVLLEVTAAVEVDAGALAWTARAGHRWLERLPVRLVPR